MIKLNVGIIANQKDKYKGKKMKFEKCIPPCHVCINIKNLQDGRLYTVKDFKKKVTGCENENHPGWIFIINERGRLSKFTLAHFKEVNSVCS